jgi:hypothetical protein
MFVPVAHAPTRRAIIFGGWTNIDKQREDNT